MHYEDAGCGVEPKKEESSTVKQMNCLMGLIRDLEQGIASLQDRISPALKDIKEDCESTSRVPTSTCEMAHQLARYNNELEVVVGRVYDILKRLDI